MGDEGLQGQPCPSSLTHQDVSLSSWLEKQSMWRQAWECRYFTLDGCRLEYRLSESQAPKKCGTVIHVDASNLEGVLAVTFLEGFSWSLRTPNGSLRQRWLTALNAAVESPYTQAPGQSEPVSPYTPGRHVGDGEFTPENSSRRWVISPSPDASQSIPPLTAGTSTPADASSQTIILSSAVEKQAAWTAKWNARVVELRRGCRLVYREVNNLARNEYLVVSVTRSNDPRKATCLLFSTSVEESFWVNFGSVEECDKWHAAVKREMRNTFPWHWFPIQPPSVVENPNELEGAMSNIWGRLVGRSTPQQGGVAHQKTSALKVHYHCSVLMNERGSGCPPSILVFGGSTQWTPSTPLPTNKKWRVPMCKFKQLSSDLVSLNLRGHLQASVLDVAAHSERVGVKERPPTLYGATISLLTLDVSLFDSAWSTRNISQQQRNQILQPFGVLIGGISSVPELLSHTTVWGVGIPSAATSRDSQSQNFSVQPYWQKWEVPSNLLPPLAFHSAVTITDSRQAAEAAPGTGKGTVLSRDQILVTGGVNHELLPTAECYLLSWYTAETSVGVVKEKVMVETVCMLPEPRAYHSSAVLSNGLVVVVGGRGGIIPSNPSKAISPLLVMRSKKLWRWEEVQWVAEPLPLLSEVTVAATPSGKSLVVLGSLPQLAASAPTSSASSRPKASAARQYVTRLYVVTIEDAGDQVKASWSTIPMRMGSIPRDIAGSTMHVYDGNVYLVGATQQLNDSSPLPLLCCPLRMVMGRIEEH